MRSISVLFKPGTTRHQQAAVLQEISAWNEVDKISYLVPNSDHPDLSRMVNAYISENADIESVAKDLEDLPEIQSATVPPSRRLQ